MSKEFIPVMLTPFRESGAIDYEALKWLTEHYIACGAKGLFANCLSSEMYELSEAERLEVIAAVLRVADRRVPVVATGTFGRDISYHAEFIRKVYALGTEAVILITSLLAEENESNEVFDKNVFQLFALTDDIPLGFYECPKPYKRLLSAEQLQRFTATGRVRYHKDTCLDLNQVKAKITAGAGQHFGLYDAYMVNAVASLKAGAAGLSCIQGNYFPALVAWLCEHFDQPGLQEEVNEVQHYFNRNMDLMHDFYPYSAKYCLQKQGYPIDTFVRNAAVEINANTRARFDQLLREHEKISDMLKVRISGLM